MASCKAAASMWAATLPDPRAEVGYLCPDALHSTYAPLCAQPLGVFWEERVDEEEEKRHSLLENYSSISGICQRSTRTPPEWLFVCLWGICLFFLVDSGTGCECT